MCGHWRSKRPRWSRWFFITLTAGIKFNLSSVEHEGLIWLMAQHMTNSKVITFSFDFLLFPHLSLKPIISRISKVEVTEQVKKTRSMSYLLMRDLSLLMGHLQTNLTAQYASPLGS